MSTLKNLPATETVSLSTWLRRLVVPRSAPGWLVVYVRTPELRIPIFVPVPVGWIRDVVRGARLSIGALDRVTAGRARTAVLSRLPAVADWYTADLQLEKKLPTVLFGFERLLDELLAGSSYTLVEVNDENVSVRIRIV